MSLCCSAGTGPEAGAHLQHLLGHVQLRHLLLCTQQQARRQAWLVINVKRHKHASARSCSHRHRWHQPCLYAARSGSCQHTRTPLACLCEVLLLPCDLVVVVCIKRRAWGHHRGAGATHQKLASRCVRRGGSKGRERISLRRRRWACSGAGMPAQQERALKEHARGLVAPRPCSRLRRRRGRALAASIRPGVVRPPGRVAGCPAASGLRRAWLSLIEPETSSSSTRSSAGRWKDAACTPAAAGAMAWQSTHNVAWALDRAKQCGEAWCNRCHAQRRAPSKRVSPACPRCHADRPPHQSPAPPPGRGLWSWQTEAAGRAPPPGSTGGRTARCRADARGCGSG